MHARKSGSLAVLGLAIALLSGCGTYPLAPSGNDLQLQVNGASPTAQTGSIRMAFSALRQVEGFLKSRYTTIDVLNVRAKLSGNGLATPLTQQTNYAYGPDLSFDQLAPGAYALQIDALNAAGQVIGSMSQPAVAVQAGQVTQLNLYLKLNPNGVIGAGDASGSSNPTATSTTGAIDARVQIMDNDVNPWPGVSHTPPLVTFN